MDSTDDERRPDPAAALRVDRDARADDIADAVSVVPSDDARDRSTEQPPTAVQEPLPFDEPVPFRLTATGRRLVAPDAAPALAVVPDADRVSPTGVPVTLEDLDAADRARARAMRRGGMHTLDIAERLDADPLHVEQWVADLPVPLRPRRRRRLTAIPGGDDTARPDETAAAARAAIVASWRAARDDGRSEAERRLAANPALRAGLGLVAGCIEPDHHALLLVGDDLELLAAAWRWVSDTFDVDDRPVRVLVRHDPAAAADRLAHVVATELRLPISSLTVTRDVARTGLDPAVRIRVADPVLAGRAAGWRRALLVDVSTTPATPGTDVGA